MKSNELRQYYSSVTGWFKCIWEPHDFTAKRFAYELETTAQPSGEPRVYVFNERCCSRCGAVDESATSFLESVYDPYDSYYE